MKAKLLLSLRVESDATPCYLVGLVSFEISPVVTLGGDHVVLY